MVFYAIFGAALLLAARARLATTVAILALAVVLAEIAGPSVPVDFYGDPIVLEFLYGMCLGAIYTRWHGNAPVALLTALLAAAAAIFASLGGDHDVTRAVSLGIPAVLVVGAAVLLERTRTVPTWRIPYLLGGASYSIYLTHSMWLKVLSKGWDKTSLPRGGVFVLGVLGSAVVGVAVFQLVEQPITRWIKRRRQREDRLVATDAVVVTTVEG
jgi:exopolysaccharide production protein ExoZ